MLVAVLNGRVQRVGTGKEELDAEMDTKWLLVDLATDKGRLKGSPAPGDQPQAPNMAGIYLKQRPKVTRSPIVELLDLIACLSNYLPFKYITSLPVV